MPADYEHIRREHVLDYGRKLKVWAQDHLANRYVDRTHFIFELLQNAEDALRERLANTYPTSVSFYLKQEGLEVRHFGKPFEPDNVESICAINESTKKDELTEIGRFGIGFKSVYAFTNRPEVHCGDEHFAIEEFVLPVAVAPRWTAEGETLFWIPFPPDDLAATTEIAQALRSLGSRRLLFLKCVTEILWSLPDGSSGVFIKSAPTPNSSGQWITLLGEATNQVSVEETWLIFSRPVSKHDGRSAGSVEIAFLIAKNNQGENYIEEVSESKLVVFFPTEQVTGLGFLIQGPYRTTPSRDFVPPKDAWNRKLVEETATLLADTLSHLKNDGLLGVEALSVMPIDSRLYPPGSMLRPLFERVSELLRTRDLLPTFGGGYSSGKCVRLARTEGMRELLVPEQLGALLGSTEPIFWLSEDITKDRAAKLREFLIHEIGSPELTPDSLTSRFNEEFIVKQSDEWIMSFYEFLNGQKSVLRELIKREIPFIRCDDGHVPPKRGELPQAFLPSSGLTGFRTVKLSVCSTRVLEFLRSIGLSEPDPVDDVIQNVLGAYSKKTVLKSEEEYESDVRRICNAYATDSEQARRKLVEGLRESHFVRSVNAQTGEITFLKPGVVYQATQQLKSVFSGVSGIWLVDDRFAALKGDHVRAMLRACGVIEVLRTAFSKSILAFKDKEIIRSKHGNSSCTWDDIDQDSDSEDVAHFLQLLPTLTPHEAQLRCVQFWNLLGVTLSDRRDSYFLARYQWKYGQKSWSCNIPAQWVQRLRNSQWVPNVCGTLRKPADICLSEAHEEIRNSRHVSFLTEILGFRPEAIKELADKEGIDLEALTLLKQYNLSAEQLRKLLGKELGGEEAEEPKLVSDSKETSQPAPVGDQSGVVSTGNPTTTNGKFSGHEVHRQKDAASVSGDGNRSSAKTPAGTGRQFYTYVGVDDGSQANTANPDLDTELREVEEAAIAFILAKDPTLQRTPTNNPGFDLYEGDSLQSPIRYVEVKSKRNEWDGAIALSQEQFRLADVERERYWLYVVVFSQDADRRHLHKIQDPAGKARYFTFDSGWKALAEGKTDHGREGAST